jgi:hypothetical protein
VGRCKQPYIFTAICAFIGFYKFTVLLGYKSNEYAYTSIYTGGDGGAVSGRLEHHGGVGVLPGRHQSVLATDVSALGGMQLLARGLRYTHSLRVVAQRRPLLPCFLAPFLPRSPPLARQVLTCFCFGSETSNILQ